MNSFDGKQLLVVEDEILIAMNLQAHLEEAGADRVTIAHDIDDALDNLAAHPVDCVLLDVNLNGMQSYPLVSALIARDIPFLLVSGYDSCSLPKALQNRPFLRKPYSLDSLDAKLLALIDSAPPDQE